MFSHVFPTSETKTKGDTIEMSVQTYLILFFSLIFITTIVSGIISYRFYKKEYKKYLDSFNSKKFEKPIDK